jgi:hypothetical protein
MTPSPTRLRWASFVVAAAVVALASGASANDEGAIEINAALAAAGLGGSDTPGFPVTITQPGHYRVTSNLDAQGAHVALIEVFASPVTIDLGGFSLMGGFRGIYGVADGVSVRNGSVSGMSETAVWIQGRVGRVERVRAVGNGFGVVLFGDGGIVADSLIVSIASGITVTSGSVLGCVVSGNTGTGISGSSLSGGLAASLVLAENVALGNGVGIGASNAAISRNLMAGNTSQGLQTFATAPGFSSVASNVISGAGAFAWLSSAVSTRPNVCAGSGC